jgi:hypothetical protein
MRTLFLVQVLIGSVLTIKVTIAALPENKRTKIQKFNSTFDFLNKRIRHNL